MPREHERPRGLVLLCVTLLWISGLPTFWPPADHATAFIPVLKAGRVAYLAVAGLLAASFFGRPEARRRMDTLDVAIAAYLALVLASWLSTVSAKDVVELKQDGDLLLTCFFMPFTAYFAARSIEWTPRRAEASLWILVLGTGACLVLIGLVQTFYDWDFLVAPTIIDHRDRAKGTFRNGVAYGITMAIFLTTVLFLHLRSAGRGRRFVSIALALAILECIVGSKTRVVWVAVPVVLGWMALRAPKLRVLAAVLVAGLALQIATPLLTAEPVAAAVGEHRWDLRSRLMQVAPVYNRIALTATALNMIRHKPFFGFGFGEWTFRTYKTDYYASWGGVPAKWAEYPAFPHNDFLNVAVLMGVVGLVFYVAVLATSWRALGAAYARQREGRPLAGELALVAQAAFLILLISGQSHDVMFISFPQVLFFFLLGMAIEAPARLAPGGER